MTNVFIYGAPKSGTTLLCNLLDGHSELFVYHNEIKYKVFGSMKTNQLDDLFFRYICSKNSSNHKYLKAKKFNIIREHLLSKKDYLYSLDFNDEFYTNELFSLLKDKKFIDGNDLILKDLNLITRSLKYNFKNIKIFKDVGGNFSKTINAFMSHNKNGKVILIVRNPYGQYNSRLKYWKKFDYPYVSLISKVESLLRLNYFYKIASKIQGKSIYIVKYEELVLNTKSELLKICYFLGIKFEEILEYPTINGNKTVVTTASIHNKSVFKSSLDSWKKQLTLFDKTLVYFLCSYSKFFNYRNIFCLNISSLLTFYISPSILFYLNKIFCYLFYKKTNHL